MPLLAIILSMVLLSEGNAQSVLSNNPAGIRWRQINTDNFQIIYPDGYDSLGQRMANTMEKLYVPVSSSLGVKPKKLSLVLQGNDGVSNGFVTIAPRRSEFQNAIPQGYNFLGNNKWLDLLAIHEFRHVAQFDKSKTGISKLLYTLFGENTQSVVAFGVVPSWFWEGDAVGVETALTKSGRGRIPYFNREVRVPLLEGQRLNFNQQYLGSFKRNNPNHYTLGYLMTSHVKNKYGVDAWDKVLDNAYRKPFMPFTFSYSMKKVTGKKLPEIYDEMMEDVQKEWAKSQPQNFDQTNPINDRTNYLYTDFKYPVFLKSGILVAQKSGLEDFTHFVSISDDGKENKVFVPGSINGSERIAVFGDKLYWNEIEYDPRWGKRTYSVIKVFDRETETVRRIAGKTRYNSVAVSPDGSKLLTVGVSPSGQQSLVVLDEATGEEIINIEVPLNTNYSMPIWGKEGNSIVVLKSNNLLKSMVELDLTGQETQVIISLTNEHFGSPVLFRNYVLFSSAISGVDNIYAVEINSGEKFKITNSEYGAYYPSVNGNTMVYNEYGAFGMDIVKKELSPADWEKFEGSSYENPMVEKLVDGENNQNVLSGIKDNIFPTRPYRSLPKIHSWGPYITNDLGNPEIGIFTQDILSTITASATYSYDYYDRAGKTSFDLSFQKFYPIIDVGVDIGNRNQTIVTDTADYTATWNEVNTRVGVRVPFRLTHNKWTQQLTFSSTYNNTAVNNYGIDHPANNRLSRFHLGPGNLIYNDLSISYYSLLKRSPRDIKSKWGMFHQLDWLKTYSHSDYSGNEIAWHSRVYLPSFFKHHSINFLYSFQYSDLTGDNENYLLPNRQSRLRGIEAGFFEKFHMLASNYALPLWYPDFSLGPWLYVKRLKANLFFDFGYGLNDFTDINPDPRNYNFDYEFSTGVELSADFNVMRWLPTLELGGRFSYLPETGEVKIEPLIINVGF